MYRRTDRNIRRRAAQHHRRRRLRTLQPSHQKRGEHVDYTRFFERFYRADESHNSSKEGFGIGLAMARELTRRMHGDISASWQQGRIAFTVTMR
ncbi:sensor histidine kinase [Bifidobacterium apri]|uniref:sensor histidine kinase n=1 Tax=Bifidobacterium apri TaxID=1769423 RepID=UPI0039925BCA